MNHYKWFLMGYIVTHFSLSFTFYCESILAIPVIILIYCNNYKFIFIRCMIYMLSYLLYCLLHNKKIEFLKNMFTYYYYYGNRR